MSTLPAPGAQLTGLRLRRYRTMLPATLGLSALTGVLLVVLLWNHVTHARLLAWLACLAAGLAGHYALARTRGGREGAPPGARLQRHRLGLVWHGTAWAASAGWLTLGGPTAVDIVAVALVFVSAGLLISTYFDARGALAFAAPTGAALAFRLGQGPADSANGTGAIVAVLVAAVLITAFTIRQRARQPAFADHDEFERSHLLDVLFQTTAQGFWFIDSDGVTLEVNPAMCSLLGRPREELLGRHVFDFVDGADLPRLQQELEARRQGQTGAYEVSLTLPGGGRRRCFNNATPLHDSLGRRVGSVGLWTDVSALREAEHALVSYRVAFDSITDMVSVIGEDRIYRLVNDTWCRVTRCRREDAIGRTTSDVLPTATTEERLSALQTCIRTRTPQVARGSVAIEGLEGRLFETSYYPYADNTLAVNCVVMVSRDITEQEHSRLQLSAATEYLRRTLNATGDAIFATDAGDAQAPIHFVNEQMRQMWQLPAEATDSLSLGDIVARMRALLAEPQDGSAGAGDVLPADAATAVHLRLRDGRVLLRRCVHADMGDRTLQVWSFRDESMEQRALELAQDREADQRSLLDAFPGFITRINEQYVYTYVNQGVLKRLGVTQDQMLGRTVLQLAGPEREAWLRPFVLRALAGEQVTYERHHEVAGSAGLTDQVTLAVGTDPNTGGRVVYSFGIDITERKRAERALTEARNEAERANRAKSEFLSRMSHELRTPLNAIMGYSELMELDPQVSARHRGWARDMGQGGRHLLALINDVLDLSRVEAGQLGVSPESVQLGPLIQECLTLVGPQAQARQIRLAQVAPSCDVHVTADRVRVKQVLLNLLSNAVKYNREAGAVRVDCSSDGLMLRLSISDTGSGLTPEQQARLFVPFERLNADLQHVEGTGIGLALSKRLVELMGGHIGVHSVPGAGSTFWVELPRHQRRGDVGST